MDDFDARLAADKRARTAEAENARLKARLAELEARLQSVDDDKKGNPPTDDEETGDADETGIDPKTGKPRKRKAKAEDEDGACDKPKTEDQEETKARATALLVVNSWRKANGLPLVSRLIQDETPVPIGVRIDPRDSETFARAVVAAHRRALNLPPLAANEWVSIKRLRGGQ